LLEFDRAPDRENRVPVTEEPRGALRLRPPALRDEEAFRLAHYTLMRERFDFAIGYGADMSWGSYLAMLEQQRIGRELTDGRVAATMLAAELGETLVGRVSIRHELDDRLAREGGHIGFAVLPAYRRRGYATAMLRQAVIIARSLGVARILVVCEEGNFGSAAVIERCGGLLDTVNDGRRDNRIRRYWID
jgi:predicted acetyltransferase